MNSIIIKLLCITLLFGDIFCNSLNLNTSKDNETLIREITCTANCLQNIKVEDVFPFILYNKVDVRNSFDYEDSTFMISDFVKLL